MGYRDVAQQFGDLIARQEYAAAGSLLVPELQTTNPPAAIEAAVATMTAYAPGPIQQAQVLDEFSLEDWPDKQPTDLAVVYVVLSGESFSEAITLTLAEYGEGMLIRDLAWGRP